MFDKKKDTAICPWCDKEFPVIKYGYRVKCPLCLHSIDVFPENKYYIDTPWGMIGIGVPDTDFFLKPILLWMIKRVAKGKEKLKERG